MRNLCYSFSEYMNLIGLCAAGACAWLTFTEHCKKAQYSAEVASACFLKATQCPVFKDRRRSNGRTYFILQGC